MRRTAHPDRTGASGAAMSACSLEQVVSPWIRAALVRDAGRLGLRGQRDARSMSEKSFKKVHFIVDGNNSLGEYAPMKTVNADRHENKNWEFRQAKADPMLPGQFIRLYRNRQNPMLFKRVAKRAGSSACNMWDGVTYTMKGESGPLKDRYGRMFWVRSVAEALRIPESIAEMEQIYKNNEA